VSGISPGLWPVRVQSAEAHLKLRRADEFPTDDFPQPACSRQSGRGWEGPSVHHPCDTGHAIPGIFIYPHVAHLYRKVVFQCWLPGSLIVNVIGNMKSMRKLFSCAR